MARFRVPHTLVLLFAMIVMALVLSYVLPQGEFERFENANGRQQVKAGTYTVLKEVERVSPLAIFTAIPRGFEAAAEIIFFVFIAGGMFAVLRRTGTVDALIGLLLDKLGGAPQLLIGGGIFIFAVGSSTIGMAEEYIPFVPVLLALCFGLGFDAVTAIGILCIGYGVGYGTALINPFTVLIAQDVAELQPTSGLGYRALLFVVFVALGIQHVWSYAKRVRNDPAASLVADIEPDPSLKAAEQVPMRGSHWLILTILLVTIGLIVWGLSQWSGWHWYVHEMGAVFLGLSVVLALVGRLSPDSAAKSFCAGAAELTTTALLIGFARSILIILEDGKVIDTLVHGISLPLTHAGPTLAAGGMLAFQSLCNLFIPSGSGQAYVTMPIMAPLGDLVGVQRQVAVLAYQFGDGLTNILVPTNAVLIGILTMARIPYDRWLRFILPFMFKAWALAAVALAVAVWFGYS